ncbi:hypothetical protein PoB_003443900 [Plakobranchus ocellatus]|uniref:Uncharacterized protein n=1 Tax=Plakobranchus ocellatus TaxID=259542 RepID=A0AAV4AP04_9GAST|nr:hypothetical protein PoB_003443900 [Plakobranchus ocellatus]
MKRLAEADNLKYRHLRLAVRCEPPYAQQTARKTRAGIHGPGIFQRDREHLLLKISFEGVEREFQIEPNSRSQPRGVHPKKNDTVNILLPLIPTTRQAF